jgi:hypothetical protein
LLGRLRGIEPKPRLICDKITGDPLPTPEGEEPEMVLSVQIDYELPPQPSTLSLRPPRSETGAPTTVGFVVYHEGVAVNDFRYLSQEQTLDLDWEDPWYSAFRNRNLIRKFSAPALGFIYVEPFEIRKEILVRPKDLQHWIDLGLEGKQVIPAAEQEELKEKVASFLGGRCPMTVDGEPVEFEFDRIHFVQRTLKQTTVVGEPVDLPLSSAMIGVIFVHRRDGLAKEATMTWDLFNEKITSMRGATHDQAGPFPWTVTPDDPVLKWTNYLKNPKLPSFITLEPPPAPPRFNVPFLSTVCGAFAMVGFIVLLRRRNLTPKWVRLGTPLALVAAMGLWPFAHTSVRAPFAKPAAVAADEATELITGLLRNVYRAFDYRDEDAVYDSLARSVSGDLLTEMYVEVYNVLYLQSQGGAKVKVDTLEMLEAESEEFTDRVGFSVRCRWNVIGKVDHWGHIHTRTNQYEATFSVEAIDGKWKITTQDFAGAKRIG